MFKRVVVYGVVVAMIGASAVSCNRDKSVEPPPPETSGNDGGGGVIDDPGKVHNEIVERFFEQEWQGERMTKDELVNAVMRASNDVFAGRGVGAMNRADFVRGVEALDDAKRAGAFDFFSGETQDLQPLIQYLGEQGLVTRAEAETLEAALATAEATPFDPAKSKGLQSRLNRLDRDHAVSPVVNDAIDVLGHSHEFWSSFSLEMSAAPDGHGGPIIIDHPNGPLGSFSYKTLVTIAVDALAMIAAAILGPIVSLAVGALASIAFYTFAPDECEC